MRRFILAFAFCLSITGPVFAEDAPAVAATARDTPKPEIITDEENGVVRILIGGKEVLRIDASGLHVTGDVDFTGTITDIGTGSHAP